MSDSGDAASGEVVELLQQLIRNHCVNDGTVTSGDEARSAQLLADYLDGSGASVEMFESEPGRSTVVARSEGSDTEAPTLLYLGHTDVVPANADNWRRDPFGGELVDGEVWGRGAVDMLNLTAAMAVAFRRHATDPRRRKGTLIYCGVADEEALGTYGAGWMVEHALDSVRADYVITESGGIPLDTPGGTRLPVVNRRARLGTAPHRQCPRLGG
jgi:acetylornithine deacetylase/succinyl-diaminopimelate desuccinylase-like protein